MTQLLSADSLLHAVHECAQLAGSVALAHYRTGIAVETKTDGSPVTIADRAAERAVCDWIRARCPDDGIVGEEFGERPGTSGRRWIIDPIDGTKSFVRGVPLWGSLVAIMEGDDVLAGAASFPAAGETIAAAVGCGCWHNDQRTKVSAIGDLRSATVLVSDACAAFPPANQAGWEVLAHGAGICRSWGDAFGYLMVATGRAEIMIDAVVNAWDVACFVPILEEAGGVFTDLSGKRTAFGGHSIGTNAALAAASREILCRS